MVPSDLFMFFSGLLAIFVLVAGADKVIANCIMLMRKKGYSGTFLGLTVISIGTSLPEIVTHIVASVDILAGKIPMHIASATALGTNIGSDIVQQNLIIALVGLLGFLKVTKKFLRRDFLIMIVTAVFLFLLSVDGVITRVDGLLLLVGYFVYLYYLHWDERHHTISLKKPKKDIEPLAMHWFAILGGLVAIVIAGHVMLVSTSHFVDKWHLGGSLVGIVIIGVATALPELTTSMTAIMKKQAHISLATLVGSNITNPAFGIGLGALISTYTVPHVITWFDLPVKIVTALAILAFFTHKMGLQRKEAIAMIGLYFLYIIVRIVAFPTDVF